MSVGIRKLYRYLYKDYEGYNPSPGFLSECLGPHVTLEEATAIVDKLKARIHERQDREASAWDIQQEKEAKEKEAALAARRHDGHAFAPPPYIRCDVVSGRSSRPCLICGLEAIEHREYTPPEPMTELERIWRKAIEDAFNV